jgi:hypothetical protein
MPPTLEWGVAGRDKAIADQVRYEASARERAQSERRPPPAPPPLADSTEGEFAIVGRNVLLSDQSATQGVNCRLFGDVARLSTGRLVARWGDAEKGYACMTYNPTAVRSQVTCGLPTQYSVTPHDHLAAGWHRMGESLQEKEVARFRQEWPHVADRLELHGTVGPHQFFAAGATHYPKAAHGGSFTEDAWRGYVVGHCGGYFGIHGAHATTPPVTLDELWTLPEQPIEIQNRAAIVASRAAYIDTVPINAGPRVVRSRFLLTDSEQAVFSRPSSNPNRRYCVDVLTVIGRGTLCTIGAVD